MNKYKNVVLIVFGLLLSSCFNFGEGEFTATEVGGTNPAWISIEYPTDQSAYVTNDNAIYLSGSAFVSDKYLHGPPWDSGVAVMWNNSLTGESGMCVYYTDVLIPFIETKWNVYISVGYGNNSITITAYEYLATPPDGYGISKTIVVTRN